MKVMPFSMPAHNCLSEAELRFHPDRKEDRHIHPLTGLVEFGPYSQSAVANVFDPIRVAVIAPAGESARVADLIHELHHVHQPRERRAYLVEFPGFSHVFKVRCVQATGGASVELARDTDAALASAHQPHSLLADRLIQAISAVEVRRTDFDVLAIVLPERWNPGFYGPAGEDFDLHDTLKAVTAARGIPLQILREDRVFEYPCRCSVMWRIGIALYCKAGGVPWKLADHDPESAFIGLSYAMRHDSTGAPRFVTCCSQVFDADGTGLEFIAYEPENVRMENDNPFLSRTQMRRVMARSMALYQRRHAGSVPKRVVVHKSTYFTPDEVEGCFDAWPASDGLVLIQVQQDSAWRGVQINPPLARDTKGTPARYPCRRGTYLPLGGREVLLWTQGNVPTARHGDFYKEGKGIPSPLLLTRFAGHGGWDEDCRDLLGLTKMNWNNDNLYDRLPVTMGYAKVLARTVKRMPRLAPQPYQFRMFM